MTLWKGGTLAAPYAKANKLLRLVREGFTVELDRMDPYLQEAVLQFLEAQDRADAARKRDPGGKR